jgi:hypothetical protein
MPAQNMSTLGCCNRVQLVAGYIDFTFPVHELRRSCTDGCYTAGFQINCQLMSVRCTPEPAQSLSEPKASGLSGSNATGLLTNRRFAVCKASRRRAVKKKSPLQKKQGLKFKSKW